MDKAGIDYSFNNYVGAKHSFTNPGADKYGKEFNLPVFYLSQLLCMALGASGDDMGLGMHKVKAGGITGVE